MKQVERKKESDSDYISDEAQDTPRSISAQRMGLESSIPENLREYRLRNHLAFPLEILLQTLKWAP